jgi:aryl-alcohol dehydrogenase-like predicted oxidoreductase
MEKLVLGTVALPNVPGGSFQLLSDAYERGFCRFDLARSYGGGKCEELFGQWLDKSGVNREDLLLITKGGMGVSMKLWGCSIDMLQRPLWVVKL